MSVPWKNRTDVVGAVMIDASKFYLRTILANDVQPSDQFITVAAGAVTRFKPAEGTHYYLTIGGGSGVIEVVRVTATSGNRLFVERGLDGTEARAWKSSTCISFQWNPLQLCEMINSCRPEPTCFMPGKYKITCDSVLEVAADGRLVSINGEGSLCSDQ